MNFKFVPISVHVVRFRVLPVDRSGHPSYTGTRTDNRIRCRKVVSALSEGLSVNGPWPCFYRNFVIPCSVFTAVNTIPFRVRPTLSVGEPIGGNGPSSMAKFWIVNIEKKKNSWHFFISNGASLFSRRRRTNHFSVGSGMSL